MSTTNQAVRYAIVPKDSFAWRDSLDECFALATEQVVKYPQQDLAIVRLVATVSAEVTPIVEPEPD